MRDLGAFLGGHRHDPPRCVSKGRKGRLSRVMRRLQALAFIGAMDSELDAELHYHLEREVEQKLASGMSTDEARFATCAMSAGWNKPGSNAVKPEG